MRNSINQSWRLYNSQRYTLASRRRLWLRWRLPRDIAFSLRLNENLPRCCTLCLSLSFRSFVLAFFFFLCPPFSLLFSFGLSWVFSIELGFSFWLGWVVFAFIKIVSPLLSSRPRTGSVTAEGGRRCPLGGGLWLGPDRLMMWTTHTHARVYLFPWACTQNIYRLSPISNSKWVQCIFHHQSMPLQLQCGSPARLLFYDW